jgi:uncharacterized membrane protein YiaA
MVRGSQRRLRRSSSVSHCVFVVGFIIFLHAAYVAQHLVRQKV